VEKGQLFQIEIGKISCSKCGAVFPVNEQIVREKLAELMIELRRDLLSYALGETQVFR
jgi:uncharacterized protein (UPF0212 family)